MSDQNWEMSGDYIESCNCDYLCPCIYTNPQGPATHDNCIALMAFRIDRLRHIDKVGVAVERVGGLAFARMAEPAVG